MQVAPNSPHQIIVVQGSQAPVRPPHDPSDQIRAYKVLGGMQIIIGLLLILFQVIYDMLSDESSNGYSGYWFGILVFWTGVTAIASIKTRLKGWFIFFLILSILNCILGISVMSVNLAAGFSFFEAREYKGLTDTMAAFSGIEGFIIALISAGFGCGGLGACMCCDKPALYKDDSPPPPNYQTGPATVIQGQTGQVSLIQGQAGQQLIIQGAGGQAVVQGQQTVIQGQPMVIQGQPMVTQGQGGVQILQQSGYPPNIQPSQGYMAPPSQYPPSNPPLQGNMVAPPPYNHNIQPHIVPSAPPAQAQNQSHFREALVHKRNALDYELPNTPDEGNREHPFLREGNRENQVVHEDQAYEEIPADSNYEQLDDYERPRENNYERPGKKLNRNEQPNEERYVKLGKNGKKNQAKQTEQDNYEKLDKKGKKDKTYDKLKKK